MEDIPKGVDDANESAEELVRKEAWIKETLDLIVHTRVLLVGRISPFLAADGVRFASLWRDDFDSALSDNPATSREELTQRMKEAKRRAWSLSETDHRYSSDMPSLQLTVAAYDAFCLSFGEEASLASSLLEWNMEPYGIPFEPSVQSD